MSEYWGLRCSSAPHEVGDGLEAADVRESESWYNHGEVRLRAAVALKGAALTAYAEASYAPLPPELDWLAMHPDCEVEVVSECGDISVREMLL